jgi:hypothetical protein
MLSPTVTAFRTGKARAFRAPARRLCCLEHRHGPLAGTLSFYMPRSEFRFVIVLLACIIFPSLVLAQRIQIDRPGDFALTATLGKSKANVVIHTVRRDDIRTLGNTAVRNLQISVDGERIFVPRSVFADMVDTEEATLRSQDGEFVLSITGSDAADSYILLVFFKKGEVTRRVLYSALDPNHPTEETKYWMVVIQ